MIFGRSGPIFFSTRFSRILTTSGTCSHKIRPIYARDAFLTEFIVATMELYKKLTSRSTRSEQTQLFGAQPNHLVAFFSGLLQTYCVTRCVPVQDHTIALTATVRMRGLHRDAKHVSYPTQNRPECPALTIPFSVGPAKWVSATRHNEAPQKQTWIEKNPTLSVANPETRDSHAWK